MREIKFRGKRIDNNEWIYGYLLYDYDMADDYVPFIIWKDERYLGGSGEEQIIEHTIGQYTGLKDKNGKEIYEGDRVYIIPEDEYGEIEWNVESARFIVIYDNIITDFDNWNGKDLEVVGTIYD